MTDALNAHFAGGAQYVGLSELHVGNGGPTWHADVRDDCVDLPASVVPKELGNFWFGRFEPTACNSGVGCL